MERHATLSDCGTYRYDLHRRWGDAGAPVCWVMLNPSTADATIDDPTIRRCIGFTRSWGYNSLTVVNLWALRATDPIELAKHSSPQGPLNAAIVEHHVACSSLIVLAWGAHKPSKLLREPPVDIDRMIRKWRRTAVFNLGTTKDGSPRHPLYVRADTPLQNVSPI